MKQDLYTIQEVAKLLGVSTKTLRRWEESGMIQPIRTLGNQRRYRIEDIKKLQRNRRLGTVRREISQEVAPELNDSATPPSNAKSVAPVIAIPVDRPAPKDWTEPTFETPEPAPQIVSPIVKRPELSTIPMNLSSHNAKNQWGHIFVGGLSAIVIIIGGMFLMLDIHFQGVKGLHLAGWGNAKHRITKVASVQSQTQAVLAANTAAPVFQLQINVPSIFGKKVNFLDSALIKKSLTVTGLSTLNGGVKTNGADINAGKGKVTGSNLVYSVQAGSNITVTGDKQNPTISAVVPVSSVQGQTGAIALTNGSGIGLNGLQISNTGVLSLQGSTGAVSLTNGSGITLNGLQISNSGVLSLQGQTGSVSLTAGTGIGISGTTITNTDTGSAQNIFKTVTVGATNIIAANNNDTLSFAAGSGIILSGDSTSKTITITSNASGTLSGLTTNGVLYATSSNSAGSTTAGTNGTVLHGVTGGAPVFSAVNLTSDVTGILPFGNGGTGVGSTPTNGQVLIGNGSGFSLGTISGTPNQVTVTNGVGTVTLSLPQNIDTTAVPSFSALTLSSNTNELTLGTGNTGIFTLGTLTASRTYTLPDLNGTVCLDTGNCAGVGGIIAGTGSANFVAKFTSSSGVSDSSIYDNGHVGIGTTSPQGLFSVSGAATGKALVNLNETGGQDILVGSESGATKFVFDANGDLNIIGGSYEIGGVSVLSSNTLGNNVLNSSLTSVGALNSGTITAGFGNIDVGTDLISGGDITSVGTTGYTASGTGAGLTFSGINNHLISATSGVLQLGAVTLTGDITGNAKNITGLGTINGLAITANSGTITSGTWNGSKIGALYGGTGLDTSLSTGVPVISGGVWSVDSNALAAVHGGTGQTGYAIGDILYANSTTTLARRTIGSDGQILTVTGGVPVWSNPGGAINYWQEALGALSPINITDDLILGATSTGSAKFAFENVAGGIPTASISANAANYYTYLTGDGTLGTTNKQSLTIGSASTGNIILNGFSIGLIHSNASGVLSSSAVSLASEVTGILPVANGGSSFAETSGSIIERNTTEDLLLGASATTSAKFAFENVAGGVPTASISANSGNNALYVTGDGTLATTNKETLTLGSASTGNIVLNGFTGNNAVLFAAPGTGVLSSAATNTDSLCLLSNGTTHLPSWQACPGGGGSSPFTLTSNVIYPTTISNQLGIGTTTAANVISSFYVTHDLASGATGKALAIFNQTENQDLLTASASGSTKFILTNNGSMEFTGGSNFLQTVTSTATHAQTVNIPDFGGGSQDLCLTSGNCAGSGSGVTQSGGSNTSGQIAYFTSSNNITSNANFLWNGDFEVGGANGGKAAAIINQLNSGDIFTASASGSTRFTIANDGTLTDNKYGTGVAQFSSTGVLSSAPLNVGGGTSYISGILPVANGGSPYDVSNGSIIERNTTEDLLLGSTATSSAKFDFINVNTGVPTASISANNGNSAFYVTGDGTIATTNRESLTIGSTSTGIISLGNSAQGVALNLGSDATGDIYFRNGAGMLSRLGIGGNNTCLSSNGSTPTWGSCAGLGTNFWQEANGILAPLNTGDDLLLGATATSSAKFGFLNNASGVPTASISANNGNNATYLTGNGTLATTNRQTLAIGSSSTGNIAIGNGASGVALSLGSDATGDIYYRNATGNLSRLGIGGAGQILSVSGGLPSWSNAGGIINFWQEQNGAVEPLNITDDLLLGATATSAAKFGFLNNAGGVPTASIAGTTANNALYLTGNGTLATTNRQTLNIGSASTGNIVIGNSASGVSINLGSDATGDLYFRNASGTLSRLGIGGAGQILSVSGGLPNWTSAGGTINFWQEQNGAVEPLNITDDLLLGATATTSAKFAVLNMAGGTPTASVAGNFIVMPTIVGGSQVGGKLGIGTNTPAFTLDVNAGNTLNGGERIYGTASDVGLQLVNTSSNIGWFLDSTGPGTFYGSGNLSIYQVGLGGNPAMTFVRPAGFGGAGYGVAINLPVSAPNNTAAATFDVRAGSATLSVASVSGATNFASLVVDQSGNGDILTASRSGATKFTVLNNGNISMNNYNNCGMLTTTGTVLTCSSPTVTTNYWQLNNNALAPANTTYDLLLGGTATTSAKFAVLNMAGGTPTASVAGNFIVLPTIVGGSQVGGNVGIGTNAPTNTLDINSGSSSNGLRLTGSPTDLFMQLNNTSGTDWFLDSSANNSLNGPGYLTIQPLLGSPIVSLGTAASINGSGGALGVNVPGIGASAHMQATVDIRAGSSILAVASMSGATTFANTVIDQSGVGDIFTASKSGKTKFTITNAGNVLMDYNNSLQFNDNTGVTQNILSYGTSGGFNNMVTLFNPDSTGSVQVGVSNATSQGDVQFLTQNLERMRITHNGFVAIGNTTPGNDMFVVNQPNAGGDIFSASKSGVAKFTIANDGTLTAAKYTTDGGILYTNGTTGLVAQTAAGSSGQILESNGSGAPTWVNASTVGVNFWQLNNNALSPVTSYDDLLLGGTSTSSAKFGFLNNGSGTPTASISAQSGTFSALALGGDGSIQTVRDQTLTIGGTTTGNITLSPLNGSGTTTNNGTFNISSSKTYQIGGSDVLSSSTLFGVTTASSLTTVGALNAGSITSGFGAIDVGNDSIAGGNLTGTGTITFSNAAFKTNNAVLYTNASTGQVNAVGATSNANLCLLSASSGTPAWGACDLGTTSWVQSQGAIYPGNSTEDLLLGGTATSSAKFAFLNLAGGTPTASVAGNFIVMQNTAGGNIGGNVGIGTISPGAKLDVVTSSSDGSSDGLRVESGDKTGYAFMDYLTTGAFATTPYAKIGGWNPSTSTLVPTVVGGNLYVGTSILPTVPSGTLLTIDGNSKGNAAVEIVQNGTGDLFSASQGATMKFQITNNGTVDLPAYGGAKNSVLFADSSTNGVLTKAAATSNANLCLLSASSGTPAWGSCDLGTTSWVQSNGTIYPGNSTEDLLLGGTATASADFAVLNLNSGTPTATIAGNLIVMPNTAGGYIGGKVGIGTTTPVSTLELANSVNAATGLTISAPGGQTLQTFYNQAAGNFWTNSSSGLWALNPSNGNGVFVGANTGVGGTDASFTVYGPTSLLRNVDSATALTIYSNFHTTNTAMLDVSTMGTDAVLKLNQIGTSDIFTASLSGVPKFTITNAGGLKLGTNEGLVNQCLTSNGAAAAVSWTACSASNSFWTMQNGLLYASNTTEDLGIGGTASTSATFHVYGQTKAGTSPVASIAANTSYAGLVIDQKGAGDIFTASQSGLTKFTIATDGVAINNIDSSTAFQLNTTSGTNIFTIDSAANHVVLGQSSQCLNYASFTEGRLCIAQNSTSGITNSTNTNSSMAFSGSGSNSIAFGNSILLKDTSSSTGTINGLYIDSSQSTNKSSTINSIFANVNSGQPGNLLDLQVSSADKLIVNNNGNVGIGTTLTGNGQLVVNQPNAGGDIFSASQSGTTQFVINNNGNVGIGVKTANANLEVSGNTYLGTQTLTANDQADVCLFSNSSCGAAVGGLFNNKLKIYGGNAQTRHLELYQQENGNAFITSTNNDLELTTTVINTNIDLMPTGGVGVGTTAVGNGELVVNQAAAGDIFSASQSGTTQFVINNAGSVGIGTAAPGFQLDVQNSTTGTVAQIYNTDTSSSSNGLQIRLGASAPNTNNSFILFKNGGNSTIGQIQGNGTGINYVNTSDIRRKENVTPTHYGLDDLMKVQVKDYDYIGVGVPTTGIIAQQLYGIYPDAVSVGGADPWTNPWGIDYGKLTPLIIKGIQDQQSQIQGLQGIVDLTDLGNTQIYNQSPSDDPLFATYGVKDTNGNDINRVGAFFKAVIGNLTAGKITANDVVLGGKSVNDRLNTIDNTASNTASKVESISTQVSDLTVRVASLEASLSQNNSGSSLSLSGTVDASNGLQLQNGTGTSTYTIEQTSPNAVANSGIEQELGGEWATIGAAGITRVTSEHNSGAASLQVRTTSMHDGVKNVLQTTLKPSTTYTVSWYIKTGSTIPNISLTAAYSYDGSSDHMSLCGSLTPSTDINAGDWQNYSCTFTTPSTQATGSNVLYILQNDSALRSFYLDDVQVAVSDAVQASGGNNLAVNGTTSPTIQASGSAYVATSLPYVVKDAQGRPVMQSGIFANAVIGNLRTGGIDTQNLVVAGRNVNERLNNLENNSSSSAVLGERVDAMSNDISELRDRVASLEATFNLLASGSALLNSPTTNFAASSSSQLGLDQLGANDATINNTLTVLGRTTVADLGVTGRMTIGLLGIDGLDASNGSGQAYASINTSSGPLMIQPQGLNGVDFLNGRLTIDTKGDLHTKGSITARKINIDTPSVAGASLGEGVLSAGDTSVVIDTSAVTNKSAIFVTPKTKTGQPLSVTEQNPGKSFKVEIDTPAVEDIKFNWWIVN